jgi:hypothetical protein
MEHDLFWSRLKPLVDRASISNLIESSCSGEHSHRTAAMELVLERSIQERRKRALVKVKDASQPDPTPQHQSSEALAPQLRSPTPVPVPTPQPPSQSTSSPVVALASAKTEVPQDPSTPPEHGRETGGVQGQDPARNKTESLNLQHTVGLTCADCGAKRSPSHFQFHLICPHTSTFAGHFKCDGCGTTRVGAIGFCTNCKGIFI